MSGKCFALVWVFSVLSGMIPACAQTIDGCLAGSRIGVSIRHVESTLEHSFVGGEIEPIILSATQQGLHEATPGSVFVVQRETGARSGGAVRQASTGKIALTVAVDLFSREARINNPLIGGDPYPIRTVRIQGTVTVYNAKQAILATVVIPSVALAANSTSEAYPDFAETLTSAVAGLLPQLCSSFTGVVLAKKPDAGIPGDSRGTVDGMARDPVPNAESPRRPERHVAIVIGVSRYQNLEDGNPPQNKGLYNLKYARKDAQDFAADLSDDTLMGRHWEVHPFLDQTATRNEVELELKDDLENALDTDVIMIFFAGHARVAGASADQIYLLTYDMDPSNPYSGLSFDGIKQSARRSKALQILMFVDACHSGGNVLGGRGEPEINTRMLDWEQNVGPARLLIASSSGSESAYEDDALKHGVFTYFLLQAISSHAAGVGLEGQSGVLTLRTVYDYVYNKVTEYTKLHRGTLGLQHPIWFGDQGAVFDNWPFVAAKNNASSVSR